MKTDTLTPIYRTLGILALASSPMLAQGPEKKDTTEMKHADHKGHAKHELMKLVAVVVPVGDSNIKGTVTFEKVADGVKVTADVGGFEPNTTHGFHIHEFGDLASDDAKSAGGHFNPDGHDHSLPSKGERHAGDLGNLAADENGVAKLVETTDQFNLSGGKHGILGRAVIIHADEDDGGQPTGNAGARIGAGVIGISKDAIKPMAGKSSAEDAATIQANGEDTANQTIAPEEVATDEATMKIPDSETSEGEIKATKDNPETIGERAGNAADTIAEKTGEMAEKVKAKSGEIAEDMKDKMSDKE